MQTIKYKNIRSAWLTAEWALGVILIVLSQFSCNPGAEVEFTDPVSNAALDDGLVDVKSIMGEKPEEALEKLDDLLAEAKSLKSEYYQGKVKWYKGYIYDEILGDVSLAYNNYNEALKNVVSSGDVSLIVKIYNNLGILYRFYKQYDAAISNYELAIELEDDLSPQRLSDLYYNYGVALKLKGDSTSFFEAERAFIKSLEYATQVDYHENIASVNNQIGLMYKAIEDYQMARIAYDNTIRTYIGNPDLQEYVGKAYHGIGVTYMDEEKVESAIYAFERALEYKRNSGSIFITKYDLGKVLYQDGQTDRAIRTWEDALTEKHDKNSIEQVQIYADLTSALQANSQFKQALGYSQIYNASVRQILDEGKRYKSKSDQVLFANVIKEYDEFNKPRPLIAKTPFLIALILAIITLVYVVVAVYYRFKSKRKVTEIVTKIQSEFLEIKVD